LGPKTEEGGGWPFLFFYGRTLGIWMDFLSDEEYQERKNTVEAGIFAAEKKKDGIGGAGEKPFDGKELDSRALERRDGSAATGSDKIASWSGKPGVIREEGLVGRKRGKKKRGENASVY